MSFTVTATDGEARAGVLRTHGRRADARLHAGGHQGDRQGLDPQRLRELGTTILLGNTYHLHFRPGEATIAELGGLHGFMGWDGPILTDSGGFQVFSLRDTIVRADDDGVTFRSVYDGEEARFTPELAAAIQAELGSDIAMCLDICLPADASRRSSISRRRGRPPGPGGSSRRPEPRASCSSGSRREARTESCAAAPSTRSRRSASTGTRSAA